MSETIVLLLAVLFAMAGVSKLRSQPAFRAVLRNFMPSSIAPIAAVLVAVSELILAVTLLFPATTRSAVFVAAAMLGLFTLFLIAMKVMGIKGCACFGEQPAEITVASGLVRNVLLILLAAAVLREASFVLWQQKFSFVLGELTVVAGAICFWPMIVALINRRHFILNRKSLS